MSQTTVYDTGVEADRGVESTTSAVAVEREGTWSDETYRWLPATPAAVRVEAPSVTTRDRREHYRSMSCHWLRMAPWIRLSILPSTSGRHRPLRNGRQPVPSRERSSGMTTGRHRLYRGGHRQANAALHRAVVVRMRYHQPTIDYVIRRRADGRTKRDIIRCLKRFLAREIYQRVMRDFRTRQQLSEAS